MAQVTINNADSGLTVRNALNGMFTEVYGGGSNAPTALTDGATISTDANAATGKGPVFTVTIAGNRLFANPTNLVTGRTYMWIITQGTTGGWTPTYGTNWDWGAAGAPTLSTAAGKVDVITAVYDGSKLLATITKGYH